MKLYGSRGAVEREFGRLKHEWALAPLRVRGLEGVHAAIALSNARLVNRLEHQAAEDPLTGLANQRAFHHACAAEFSRAQRTGAKVSIVMLDLDHFKAINDAHGHLYGDRVLLGVAEALRASSRGRDAVARMGGEEFAILLPDADADSAYEIAERGSLRDRARPRGKRRPVMLGRGGHRLALGRIAGRSARTGPTGLFMRPSATAVVAPWPAGESRAVRASPRTHFLAPSTRKAGSERIRLSRQPQHPAPRRVGIHQVPTRANRQGGRDDENA